MANELDTNQEAILNSIAAAIKTLTSTGVDINPYSVAREAEIDPVQIFNSKAAMDQLIAARGDKVSYSIDAELSLQYQEISQELEKAVAINQELYDRGSELAERVVELEAKVNDLEQEAEQLAMQLQNAWTVGYQKGLAAAREQAQAQAAAPPATASENVQSQKHPAPSPEPQTQSQAQPQSQSQAQAQAETQTLTKDQLQQLAQVEAQVQAKRSSPPSPAPTPEPAPSAQAGSITGDEIPVQPQADSMRAVEGNGEFTVNDLPSHEQIRTAGNAEVAGYNDRVFNAVKEGPAGPKPSDLYSALSWKQIETVYQYSATPGRTGANLYFDPLPSPEAEPAQPLAQPAAEPTPGPQPKVEPQPEPVIERRPKKMPNISFDPPDEPIVGASTRIEGMADSFSESLSQDPFTQSLTDIPSLGSMLNTNGQDQSEVVLQDRTAEVETSSALTALPLSEPQDDLDLDKLDIFEGLEDIEELSNIEVIEDVVLPDHPSAETPASDRAQTLGPEELRDLIKNRIKQAQEHPGEVEVTPIQVTAPAATQATAAAAAQAAADAAAAAAATPSAEAIRQGVRNKFIGGKGPSQATPGAPAPAPGATPGAPAAAGGTTDGAATATGAAPAASPGPGATSAAAAARSVPPEIRKNCMILGVRPEDLTVKTVIEAWKAQITAPGVHPDQGGDHETALYLNIAKETLVKYIEAQAPKLGKKFGQQAQTRETPKAPFTMRQNPDKGTDKK